MTVVPLRPIEGGFDFDGLFEALKEQNLTKVLVITDELDWYGNITDEEAVMLMERLKIKLAKERDE